MKKRLIEQCILVILVFFIGGGLTFIGWNIYHTDLINEHQLAYFGSIIGGSITLLGVIMNMDYTEQIRKKDKKERDQERKEELAITYKPILQIEKKEITFQRLKNSDPVYDYNEKIKDFEIVGENYYYTQDFRIKITLKNIGRGEILRTNTSFVAEDKYIKARKFESHQNIFPGDSFSISFIIDLYDYEKFIFEDYSFEEKIKVEYYDFLNNKTFIEIPIIIENQPADTILEKDNVIYGDNYLTYHIKDIIRFPFKIDIYSNEKTSKPN